MMNSRSAYTSDQLLIWELDEAVYLGLQGHQLQGIDRSSSGGAVFKFSASVRQDLERWRVELRHFKQQRRRLFDGERHPAA